MNWLIHSPLRVSLALLLALLWLGTSCTQPGSWEPTGDAKACDPGQQAHIANHTLWSTTLGGPTGRAYGCLRVSWGDKDDEGRGIYVQLDLKGRMLAQDPKTKAFNAPLSLDLPGDVKEKPRRFRLFVFGELYQFFQESQPKLCEGKFAKPSYQCQNTLLPECWFALAFRPKDPKGIITSPPIEGAGDAICQFFPPAPASQEAAQETTPEPPSESQTEPVTELPQEPVADASGTDKAAPPEIPAPETIPDTACTTGQTRPCYSNNAAGCLRRPDDTFTCTGACKAGSQSCTDGVWGACTGAVEPTAEVCDKLDNNCDGQIDEGLTGCEQACVSPCVSTLAGSGVQGSTDGKSTSALLDAPIGLVVNTKGDVIFADSSHKIRAVLTDGSVVTLAGSVAGYKDDSELRAQFRRPSGLAIDSNDNLYIADTENHVIRKMNLTTGVVTTLAGKAGVEGFTGSTFANVLFRFPRGIALGPSGVIYVADTGNHAIRKLTQSGLQASTLAGSGTLGNVDGKGPNAKFDSPAGIAVDSAGNVYVADTENHVIRKVDQAGNVTTVAGIGLSGHSDGKSLLDAKFHKPSALVLDATGNLFVADTFNLRIRKVDLAQGQVTTVAGSRNAGAKDGSALQAEFNFPRGIAIHPTGAFFLIADTDNHKLRLFLP